MKKLMLLSLSVILFVINPVYADGVNNTLKYASTKDIRDINPHLYSGEMAAQNMVYEPLVINTNEGVKPFLATNWTTSEDGKKYTFKLREDVYFSDGEKFNAEVAKLNMDAVLENSSRHAWLELVNQIESINVVDDYIIEINLKNPYYPTLTELGLTRPFRFASPKTFVNNKTKDGVLNYIGTGPWVLSEHKKNQHAIFNKNNNYWGVKPYLNAVRWSVIPDRQTLLLSLKKGEVDLIFGADGDMLDIDSYNSLKNANNIDAIMSEPIASRALVLNSNRAITNDLNVRRALQYAVDKEGIAFGILGGSESIADTLLSKTTPYADVELVIYEFNPDKAKEILDSSGWIVKDNNIYREKNNQKMEMIFSYNINNAVEKEIAQLIQDNFKDIGVSIKLLGEEKQAFLDRQRNGDFDMQYSLSWGTPYDPASYISSFRIPAHADYQGQLGLEDKDKIDSMIDDILISTNEEERKALYHNLFTILADNAVYIPLTYSRTKAIYRTEVQGVDFNPSQYEIPFEKMSFK